MHRQTREELLEGLYLLSMALAAAQASVVAGSEHDRRASRAALEQQLAVAERVVAELLRRLNRAHPSDASP